MARILSQEIPNNKRIIISLTYVFGIGKNTAQKILEEAKIDANLKTQDLTEQNLVAINEISKKYKTEGVLRREIALNIKRLMEIKTYRGIRHRKGLPVRGQVTQKNARTRKGPKKIIISKKNKKIGKKG